MLIVHHNDNDGRCAAVICAKYGSEKPEEEIRFLETNYGHAFDPTAHLAFPDELVYIVDFSIQPEEMLELLKYTKNVVWLDHHKTAIDKYADFPHAIKGIREEGERAGCLLAWEYLCADSSGACPEPPLFVKLISDYDTWTLEYDPQSKYLNYGLQTVDTRPESAIWECLFSMPGYVNRYIEGGNFVLDFVRKRGQELAEAYGYIAKVNYNIGTVEQPTIVTTKVLVMHNPNFGSDWFYLLRDNQHDAQVFARVAFNGKKYTVSLYSETIDVSVICKEYGGGGHPGAAGFSCEELPFIYDSKLQVPSAHS